MTESAAAASLSGVIVKGSDFIIFSTGSSSRLLSLLIARRMIPSVIIPAILFCLSITETAPRPFSVIIKSASLTVLPTLTIGFSSSTCITSPTVSSSLRPSAPPGWNIAKSFEVKLRFSISAIAIASPIANVAVVEAVGASPNGHASWSTPILIK